MPQTATPGWRAATSYVLVACCWLSSLSLHAQSSSTVPSRTKYNFNPEWRVLVGDPAGAEKAGFEDKAWKRVTLPYAWN